jgi:hypothetical protein
MDQVCRPQVGVRSRSRCAVSRRTIHGLRLHLDHAVPNSVDRAITSADPTAVTWGGP